MSFWFFSSKGLDNIGVAKERFLWSFGDRDACEKFRRNWRAFIKLYNRIRPFNIVVFQLAKSGSIHTIGGIVKEKYFDNQTLIRPEKREKEQILHPWRISFNSPIGSKKPFTTHLIKIENYVAGYSIGELPRPGFRTILSEKQRKQT